MSLPTGERVAGSNSSGRDGAKGRRRQALDVADVPEPAAAQQREVPRGERAVGQRRRVHPRGGGSILLVDDAPARRSRIAADGIKFSSHPLKADR